MMRNKFVMLCGIAAMVLTLPAFAQTQIVLESPLDWQVIQRNAKVRLLRDQVVVFDGKVASLKRVKDDAREVAAGLECGVALENFNDIHLGDVVESFVVEEVAPL